MARGDGKAVRGRTKTRSENMKPRYTKSGVRKMAIGGNPGDMATGGFGTGISGVTGSVDRNTAAGGTGSNIGSGSGFTGSYGGGGGGSGVTRGATAAAISAGSGGGGGVSSSRAGTSSANIAAASSPTGLANSASAAMHAAMAASRTVSPTSSAAVRQATQAASATSPTGFRGTASSFSPQVSPVAGYGSTYSGAIDARTVMPGSVSLSQVKDRVPFAQSTIGASLLEQSQQPMSIAQAKQLQSKLPSGSIVTLNAASIDKTKYNSYPATVGGYNVTVGVPRSATGTVSRTVGQWNPSTASAAQTSDFRGLPSPSTAPSPASVAGTGGIDFRGYTASRATPNMELPTRTSLPASRADFAGYNDALIASAASFPSDTELASRMQSVAMQQAANDFRAPPTGSKYSYDRIAAVEDLGQPNLNPYAGLRVAQSTTPQMPQRPISPTPVSAYAPTRTVSSGPSFETYGRGSSYPSAPTPAAISPLQTSTVVAAALGSSNMFPRGDGGGSADRIRRRRLLASQQDEGDQISSGTTAMKSGGRVNGKAHRGWTRGREV